MSLNSGNTNSYLNVKQDQLTCYQHNTIESCRNDIEFTQDRLRGFRELDGDLNRIIEKLIFIKNDPR